MAKLSKLNPLAATVGAAAKKVAKVAVVKKALKVAAARKAPRANVAMTRKAKASVVKANAAVVPNKAGANA